MCVCVCERERECVCVRERECVCDQGRAADGVLWDTWGWAAR